MKRKTGRQEGREGTAGLQCERSKNQKRSERKSVKKQTR